MPVQPQSEARGRAQTRGVRVGVVLFILGLAFVAGDITAFFVGDRNTPLWLNLACLLVPIGFAVAVWSGLRAGRREQRAAVLELNGAGNRDVAD